MRSSSVHNSGEGMCTSAFVHQPTTILFSSRRGKLSNRRNRLNVEARRSYRIMASTKDDIRDERPAEVALTNDSPDYIVDIDGEEPLQMDYRRDEEYAEEGVDVVDVLGADFDVSVEGNVMTEKRKKVRKHTSAFLEEISQEPESSLTYDAAGFPPIQMDESTAFAKTAVRAADERKAEDIVAIRVSKLTYITSFVIVATANNTPQIRAVANLIEEDLAKKHQLFVKRKDGTANSGWMLLDCTCQAQMFS